MIHSAKWCVCFALAYKKVPGYNMLQSAKRRKISISRSILPKDLILLSPYKIPCCIFPIVENNLFLTLTFVVTSPKAVHCVHDCLLQYIVKSRFNLCTWSTQFCSLNWYFDILTLKINFVSRKDFIISRLFLQWRLFDSKN